MQDHLKFHNFHHAYKGLQSSKSKYKYVGSSDYRIPPTCSNLSPCSLFEGQLSGLWNPHWNEFVKKESISKPRDLSLCFLSKLLPVGIRYFSDKPINIISIVGYIISYHLYLHKNPMNSYHFPSIFSRVFPGVPDPWCDPTGYGFSLAALCRRFAPWYPVRRWPDTSETADIFTIKLWSSQGIQGAVMGMGIHGYFWDQNPFYIPYILCQKS